MVTPLLGSLYRKQNLTFSELSILEREIHAYLIGEAICLENLLSGHIPNFSWRELFLIKLIASLSKKEEASHNLIKDKFESLSKSSHGHRSQYRNVIEALYLSFSDLPVPSIHPKLLENGAAPLELGGYCPWREIPYNPVHAEYGTLLSILALRNKDKKLISDIIKMAVWQVNTLSKDKVAFPSLFVQREQPIETLPLWNALFFQAAFILSGNPIFEETAQRQIDSLSSTTTISPIFVLLEKIIQMESACFIPQAALEGSFTKSIFIDSSTALAISRHSDISTYGTLHGSYTGMGSFLKGKAGVVNFGPHYLPFENLQGFGIEGSALSDKGQRKSEVKKVADGYSIKGCVRLVDANDATGLGRFSGVWLDTEQTLVNKELDIRTSFLGFDGWKSIGFSFLVNADRFQVEKENEVSSVKFFSGEEFIEILPIHSVGSMQVKKLEEGFWGANFVVTFVPDPSIPDYAWKIK